MSYDLLVLSHLRWDFVFQRPQHLLTRFAAERRVHCFEEPVFDGEMPSLEVKIRDHGVRVLVPHLPTTLTQEDEIYDAQARLLDQYLETEGVSNLALWYYTPMALPFTRHLNAKAIAYDCMDELSLFKNAHPRLRELEQELLQTADVVFTGGQSLYEFKRNHHRNIHPFPSSIDQAHFSKARSETISEPADQREIGRPRIGFFGVIDERFDIDLIDACAQMRPEWNFIILGPVVKIDPGSLPHRPNIHYLGSKSYAELPAYLSGWDVAMLPFARNESTRFISPTKTPEYLAAGCPVVSTSIRDVVRPYGDEKLVGIADTPEDFVRAIETAMTQAQGDPEWRKRVDAFLKTNSWDLTWSRMSDLLRKAAKARSAADADLRVS